MLSSLGAPPQSIMLRWQPPPLSGQNGEITGYKIRYRKGSRRSEVSDTTAGTQLFKLISGKGRSHARLAFTSRFPSGTQSVSGCA